MLVKYVAIVPSSDGFDAFIDHDEVLEDEVFLERSFAEVWELGSEGEDCAENGQQPIPCWAVDIRGFITNEPPRVFAEFRENDGTSYFGFLPA